MKTSSLHIPASHFSAILGVSDATIQQWISSKKYPSYTAADGLVYFDTSEMLHIPEVAAIVSSSWEEELQTKALRPYSSIELFAGAGGLSLGLEHAGFAPILLNELDRDAYHTLRCNRPKWNAVHANVQDLDFRSYYGKADLLSGGFPCQAFSYAGKQAGFNDTRGTLFFELARAISEVQPKVFIAENVRGLLSHDNGRTLETIRNVIKELGYTLVEPKVLRAVLYKVPQKRERLILVGIRNDLADLAHFTWPHPYPRVMTLKDAFFAGDLYPTDVPQSEGQRYPAKKQQVLALVPEGGDWRDLPVEIQKEYMGKSFYLGGGKTGMARRLSMSQPSLTLTCAPAQKQTERCHPWETRPLTVREYARIQTFPDEWQFCGSQTSQYKQIGNAVPVNLSYAVGRSLVRLLNTIESKI